MPGRAVAGRFPTQHRTETEAVQTTDTGSESLCTRRKCLSLYRSQERGETWFPDLGVTVDQHTVDTLTKLSHALRDCEFLSLTDAVTGFTRLSGHLGACKPRVLFLLHLHVHFLLPFSLPRSPSLFPSSLLPRPSFPHSRRPPAPTPGLLLPRGTVLSLAR